MNPMIIPYEIYHVELSLLRHIEGFGKKRVEWLVDKIKKEGIWTAPLCIEKHHYLVMDGQHRMEAAFRLGLVVVPCMLFDYSDVEVWSLRSNHIVSRDLVITRALEDNIYPYKTVKHRFPIDIPICSYTIQELRGGSLRTCV